MTRTARIAALLLATSAGTALAEEWAEQVTRKEAPLDPAARQMGAVVGAPVVSCGWLEGSFGAAGAEPSPARRFTGYRIVLPQLTVDRLTFASPAAALDYAVLVPSAGDAVVDVRGKWLVRVRGELVTAAPDKAAQALRLVASGEAGSAQRTLLALRAGDGASAARGTRTGRLEQFVTELLAAARTAGKPGDGELQWLFSNHAGLRLTLPREALQAGHGPNAVWSARASGPDRLDQIASALAVWEKRVPAELAAPPSAAPQPARPAGPTSLVAPIPPLGPARPVPSSGYGQALDEIGGALGEE